MSYPTTFGTLPDQQSLLITPTMGVYPTTAALAADQNIFPQGAVCFTVSPFAFYQASYQNPSSTPSTGQTLLSTGSVTSTPSVQLAGAPAAIYWTQVAGVQHISNTIALAGLQAQTTATPFTVMTLPTSARLLGFDVVINTPLSGGGLSAATVTVQGTGDGAGSIVASSSVFTGATLPLGLAGAAYASRSAQAILATITATGAALSAITAGSLTFNAFVAVGL